MPCCCCCCYCFVVFVVVVPSPDASNNIEINEFKRLLSEENLNALSKEERVGLVYVWQEHYYNKHGQARYETLLREFEGVANEYAEVYINCS